MSEYFLQNLLPPSCKFVLVCTVVQFGKVKTHMEIPSHKDLEGNTHFVIESSLSKEFFINHTESTLYVSDSNDKKLNDFSFYSTPKDFEQCIQISDQSDSTASKKDVQEEDTSSSDIQILGDCSMGKQSCV